MSHRAKIAEWIKEAQEICDALECEDCPEAEKGTDRCRYAFYAEHLDWHGVVCRKEGRWIVKQVGAAEKQ